AGLVRKLVLDDAPARYEMMPHTDHDHLVDVDSGDLVEIQGPRLRRCWIVSRPRWAMSWSATTRSFAPASFRSVSDPQAI
ncbi:transcriptional repressor, partial [Sulfitobacter pontiacus]